MGYVSLDWRYAGEDYFERAYYFRHVRSLLLEFITRLLSRGKISDFITQRSEKTSSPFARLLIEIYTFCLNWSNKTLEEE